MTSINYIVKQDVAWMFGDGASYDQDGTLISVTSKTYSMPHLSAAVLFMGWAIAAPTVKFHLERAASSFDELRDVIESKLPAISNHVAELYGDDPAGEGFRLFVVGWSHRENAPRGFNIRSTANTEPPLPAFTVMDRQGLMSPGLSDEDRLCGFGGPPLVNAETITNVAITTLELQRQAQAAEGRCRVGGLVEVTEIRRDSVETRVVHRWAEDHVGDVIRPAPVNWDEWRSRYPVNDDPTAGMSKLQRDVFLRKQAKAKRRAA